MYLYEKTTARTQYAEAKLKIRPQLNSLRKWRLIFFFCKPKCQVFLTLKILVGSRNKSLPLRKDIKKWQSKNGYSWVLSISQILPLLHDGRFIKQFNGTLALVEEKPSNIKEERVLSLCKGAQR